MRGWRRTLRDSIAFVDNEYPDLVFLAPRHVAREWLFSQYQTPVHTLLSVYMRRARDPLLLLDLPSNALLRLRPRRSNHHHQHQGDDEMVGVMARVRSLCMTDRHGRHAEVEIVLV